MAGAQPHNKVGGEKEETSNAANLFLNIVVDIEGEGGLHMSTHHRGPIALCAQ